MANSAIYRKFSDALDHLIEQVKLDRSVLAAILCGSLSHDTVWAGSDIDLVLITIDDKSVDPESEAIALYSDDVNVHTFRVPRSRFRKSVEGSLTNSFMHSLLAKGRLLYTRDPTIGDLMSRLVDIGERDTRLQLFRAATSALPPIYKAHKWFETRRDLDYTALWILYSATPLAQIEIISRRLLADREVIPQAMKLNPGFFEIVYTGMLNGKKSRAKIQEALDAVDGYIRKRLNLFDPIVDYLKEIGEARTCSELEHYFQRNMGIGGVTTACEFLSDQGIIGKASIAVKLTRRSNVEVQETAFVYLGEPPDEL